jgi:S1-C subfamily serine protease
MFARLWSLLMVVLGVLPTLDTEAATTSGGSGGPLFNRNGKVIGVNFTILSDFGGSNLAVPVRYADELPK